MDLLQAIDFKKGCYVGQEVTSRTKYRGSVRKKILIVRGENLPIQGSDIIIDDIKIGIMCSTQDNVGIALIRTEDFQKVSSSNNIPFIIETPLWAAL
jgi:folate-binding Fe-S cluster repair protein YgfZ